MKGATFPFRDAGEKSDKYQGYEEGVIYINPWSKQKPGIVNSRLQDVLLPTRSMPGNWCGRSSRRSRGPIAASAVSPSG